MTDFEYKPSGEKKDEPLIVLKSADNWGLIEGVSFMEEPRLFFTPVIQWFEELADSGKESFIFDLKLSYFNTATSKIILEIFKNLIKFQEKGGKLDITWYYEDDDEDLADEIDNYRGLTDLDIQKVPIG